MSLEVAPSPYSSQELPLIVTVGFVGHRSLEQPGPTKLLLDRTFAVVSAAVQAVVETPLGQGPKTIGSAYDGPVSLRLLTGDAPGADMLAIESWRSGGFGEIHALYPFRDPTTLAPLTDHPDVAGDEDRTENSPPFSLWTGIDSIGIGLTRDGGHSELAQWILRHSDLLVAVWNGGAAAGAGGTADTVRKALERGLPVVWIEPGVEAIRLLDISRLPRHLQIEELVEHPARHAATLSAAALATSIAPFFTPPGDYDLHQAASGTKKKQDPEIAAREDYVAEDPLVRTWLDRQFDPTFWRAFNVFKNHAGHLHGWTPPRRNPVPLPTELKTQPGFQYLISVFQQADERANQLSAIHRSQQLLLSVIAVVAVLIGASPALAPTSSTLQVHQSAAVAELLLAGLTAILAGNAARAHRHRRWSDARRLAERLRGALATWPLNVELGDFHLGPAQTWTEWRALAIVRAAGPPRHWFGRREFVERGAWASWELLGEQINYHAKEQHAAQHIAVSLRHLKEGAFTVLIGALLIFLMASYFPEVTSWKRWPFFLGLTTVVGSISPAIAAAALSLEATNGFEELALRSTRMRAKFEELLLELSGGVDAIHVHHAREVLRSAAKLLSEDADDWRNRAVRRKIVTSG